MTTPGSWRNAWPGRTWTIFIFGLLEEVGEVAGKMKRYKRGDMDRLTLEREIYPELGDVLFYLTAAFLAIGRLPRVPEGTDASSLSTTVLTTAVFGLVRRSGQVAESMLYGVDLKRRGSRNTHLFRLAIEALLVDVLSVLNIVSAGSPPEQALLDLAIENHAKIIDRLARGAIKGNGDKR